MIVKYNHLYRMSLQGFLKQCRHRYARGIASSGCNHGISKKMAFGIKKSRHNHFSFLMAKGLHIITGNRLRFVQLQFVTVVGAGNSFGQLRHSFQLNGFHRTNTLMLHELFIGKFIEIEKIPMTLRKQLSGDIQCRQLFGSGL